MFSPISNQQYLAHISSDGSRVQTVQEHLRGTASLAEEFGRSFHAEDQAYLAGLLHDVGKYSIDFQQRLHGGPPVDHSTAGMKEALALHQPEVAFAIAGHHSGLPDGGSKTDTDTAGTLLGRQKREIPEYDTWRREIQPVKAGRPSQIPRDNFSESFYIRMLFSCLVDADYQDTQLFMEGPVPRGDYEPLLQLLGKLNLYIQPWWDAKTELNRKRCEILHTCITAGQTGKSGLYTLTVPTGGGKTVSSLAFALNHAVARGKSRVIYVIPYTSIIDQTADIFQHILGTENVIEHHSGIDYSVPEDHADSFSYRKALATEDWDAPIIVTTAVQFFESLYSNRSSRCRKLHNIANSVVIFDEAQALPVGQLRPCVAAIGQLVKYYSVTAVLCTATQPALQPIFSELAPGLSIQEICPGTTELYRFFQRTTLHRIGEVTEEDLVEQLSAARQTLCVVNRRATAQSLYARLDSEGRYCLTTLLCPADRKRLLEEIRLRLKYELPCRVVSTSLIEAGVDVDFPSVWREEAGLDSVLQTAGRCNREGKHASSESIVSIFRLQGSRVPAMIRANVDSARHVLDLFQDPAQPEAIETYFSFYRAVKGTSALDQDNILDAFAKGFEGQAMPFASVADLFQLIDNRTLSIYLPIDEGAALVERLRSGQVSQSLYRRLGLYSVNIYPEHVKRLLDAGAIQPIDNSGYVLSDLSLYNRSTGLSLDVETGKGIFI